MSDDSADQIHPATPARYEQARRDGDVAKSFELAAAVQMLGAIGVAWLSLGPLANWLRESTSEIWNASATSQSMTRINQAEFTDQIQHLMFSSLSVLAPIGFMLIGFGIVAHWCQTGPMFLAQKTVPELSRLAPSNWLRRIFSLSTMAYPVIGLPKSLLAMGVMLFSCWINRDAFFQLGSLPVDDMVKAIFQLVLTVSSHVAVTLLLASVLDYGLKYLGFQKRIRMTDQQLRDESKMQGK